MSVNKGLKNLYFDLPDKREEKSDESNDCSQVPSNCPELNITSLFPPDSAQPSTSKGVENMISHVLVNTLMDKQLDSTLLSKSICAKSPSGSTITLERDLSSLPSTSKPVLSREFIDEVTLDSNDDSSSGGSVQCLDSRPGSRSSDVIIVNDTDHFQKGNDLNKDDDDDDDLYFDAQEFSEETHLPLEENSDQDLKEIDELVNLMPFLDRDAVKENIWAIGRVRNRWYSIYSSMIAMACLENRDVSPAVYEKLRTLRCSKKFDSKKRCFPDCYEYIAKKSKPGEKRPALIAENNLPESLTNFPSTTSDDIMVALSPVLLGDLQDSQASKPDADTVKSTTEVISDELLNKTHSIDVQPSENLQTWGEQTVIENEWPHSPTLQANNVQMAGIKDFERPVNESDMPFDLHFEETEDRSNETIGSHFMGDAWVQEKIALVASVVEHVPIELITEHVRLCFDDLDINNLIMSLTRTSPIKEWNVVNRDELGNENDFSEPEPASGGTPLGSEPRQASLWGSVRESLFGSKFEPQPGPSWEPQPGPSWEPQSGPSWRPQPGPSWHMPAPNLVPQVPASSESLAGASSEHQPGPSEEAGEEIEENAEVKREQWIESHCKDLCDMFPDADPEYLSKKCTEMVLDSDAYIDFVSNLTENRDYPSMKQYLERKKRTDMRKKFIDGMSVPEFLELFEDPEAIFMDVTATRSPLYCQNARTQLLIDLPYYLSKDIDTALSENKLHYLPSLIALKSRRFVGRRKSKRKDIVHTDELDDFFIKELCYVRLRDQIDEHRTSLKKARSEAFELAKKEDRLLTCDICCEDELLWEDMRSCGADAPHMYCLTCIRRHCEEQIGQGCTKLNCIHHECEVEYSLNVLKSCLKSSVFSNLLKRKEAQEIKDAGIEDLEMCPFCDFATIIPNKENKVFNCRNPECFKDSCRLCKQLSHIPLKCEEVETQSEIAARTFIENKMSEAMVRECYKCGKRFIKEDGCNKMSCSCGAIMCYLCKKPIKGYNHFKDNTNDAHNTENTSGLCPLWTNSLTLHAEEVKKMADEAKKAIDPSVKLKYDPTKDLPKVPENLRPSFHRGGQHHMVFHNHNYANHVNPFFPLVMHRRRQEPELGQGVDMREHDFVMGLRLHAGRRPRVHPVGPEVNDVYREFPPIVPVHPPAAPPRAPGVGALGDVVANVGPVVAGAIDIADAAGGAGAAPIPFLGHRRMIFDAEEEMLHHQRRTRAEAFVYHHHHYHHHHHNYNDVGGQVPPAPNAQFRVVCAAPRYGGPFEHRPVNVQPPPEGFPHRRRFHVAMNNPREFPPVAHNNNRPYLWQPYGPPPPAHQQ